MEPSPAQLTPYPEDTLPDSARQWKDGPTEEEMPSPESGK